MRDALKHGYGRDGRMFLFVLDNDRKYKGKMEIRQCSARRYYTFFDLILSHRLNIVPIIGVGVISPVRARILVVLAITIIIRFNKRGKQISDLCCNLFLRHSHTQSKQ